MTYLQSNHPDFNNLIRYAAISDERIEKVPLSEAYDEYGQKVGHENAGDYLYIITQVAADTANNAYNESEENEEFEVKYKIGDVVSAYDATAAFDAFISLPSEDVELELIMAEGFTYWTGNNHKTIILDCTLPDYESDWSIVTDDELIAELDAAIENMVDVGQSTGIQSYKSADGKWGIDDSCWQGVWSKYDIMLMEDVETLAAYPEYQ